jgi:uncharacterized protein YndB with AHSA1/START domain
MTVIRSEKDAEKLTLRIVAQLAADRESVWRVWEDPRKLERWWGPPTFPATFTRHEFVVGGQSRYHMTGPAGETPRGWWRIELLEKPSRIEFANGLAGEDGEPAPGVQPMPSQVTFEAIDESTVMTVLTRFTSVEQMERMITMGMEEGMGLAIGQIDALLDPIASQT